MDVCHLFEMMNRLNVDLYTGVPDSLLHSVCEYLRERCDPNNHIVAANEGGAVAIAAGHYLATGHPALVYMQNSGMGNAVNPICSLLSDRVYAVPALFLIGWRGEPGVKDEPQHTFQGEITLSMLECLGMEYTVIDSSTDASIFEDVYLQCKSAFAKGLPYTIVVKKGALSYRTEDVPNNQYPLTREGVLEVIASQDFGRCVFVCTTGKLSRELFEIRERNQQSHEQDFLTVGSMGHSLMIALGIARSRPELKVFCLDGDGAMLMHMGATAIVGELKPKNLYHILINNGAHESVGGMPTAAGHPNVDLPGIVLSCGYDASFSVDSKEALLDALQSYVHTDGPIFIEVCTNLSVRTDLGRPTTTPIENKDAFMRYVRGDI